MVEGKIEKLTCKHLHHKKN